MIFSPFNVGYGGAGGSIDSQALSGFNSWSTTATGDLMPTRMILVSRARQLAITNPMASAVIDRMVGGIIGTGLSYAYQDTSEYINEPFYYPAISSDIKAQFKLASHLHTLDSQGRQNFNQMQELACRNWLLSGDIFFVRKGMGWRAIESDRCQSPYYLTHFTPDYIETTINPDTQYRIVDGVELDDDAKPVAYWFLTDYIEKPLLVTPDNIVRVPAIDEETGLPNVLHIFKPLRPDQYRGIPILADIIEPLHSTRNYIQAEIQAAQFQSAIWGFLTSANPTFDETEPLSSRDLDRPIPVEGEEEQEDPVQVQEQDSGEGNKKKDNAPTMQLDAKFASEADQLSWYDRLFPKPKTVSAGQLWHLKEGEDVKFLQSTHPNNNFDAFIKSQNGMVASAVGIPRQVLECSYDGTYASARGSVLEANRTFKTYRSYFIDSFVKPVFQSFAYDYFINYLNPDDTRFISTALTIESIWQAPTALCLDPVKEVEGWKLAIELGLVERDSAAQALYGHNATGTPAPPPDKTEEIDEV